MSDLNERVIDEAEKRGDKMLVDDFVRLIERHERGDEPGVAIDRVVAHAEELNARAGESDMVHDPMDPAAVRDAIDDRLTDSPTRGDPDALYEVGIDRVSVYPSNWHDELSGETDLARYVEVIERETDEDAEFYQGGPGRGIPENVLIDAAVALGGLERDEANAEIERLRDEGIVSEDIDQHPKARVRLEKSESERDGE